PSLTLFPYTTLFRSLGRIRPAAPCAPERGAPRALARGAPVRHRDPGDRRPRLPRLRRSAARLRLGSARLRRPRAPPARPVARDRPGPRHRRRRAVREPPVQLARPREEPMNSTAASTADTSAAEASAATASAADTAAPAPPLLQVEDLRVAYGPAEVVHGVSFAVGAGRALALIGESGSGKSTIARAVLRLLGTRRARVDGSIRIEGREVTGLREREFLPLRGRVLGFVPQDPGSSLNPVRTIRAQALEAAALVPGARRSEEREALVHAALER